MAMREKKQRRGPSFFSDVRSELKKVVYPTGKTVRKNTFVVIIVVLIIGGFVAALDFGLINARNYVVQNDTLSYTNPSSSDDLDLSGENYTTDENGNLVDENGNIIIENTENLDEITDNPDETSETSDTTTENPDETVETPEGATESPDETSEVSIPEEGSGE